MKISDLIKELEKIKEKHGDIPVYAQTLTHRWTPDLGVRKDGGVTWLLLNS